MIRRARSVPFNALADGYDDGGGVGLTRSAEPLHAASAEKCIPNAKALAAPKRILAAGERSTSGYCLVGARNASRPIRQYVGVEIDSHGREIRWLRALSQSARAI